MDVEEVDAREAWPGPSRSHGRISGHRDFRRRALRRRTGRRTGAAGISTSGSGMNTSYVETRERSVLIEKEILPLVA